MRSFLAFLTGQPRVREGEQASPGVFRLTAGKVKGRHRIPVIHLLEIRKLTPRTAHHQNQITVAHPDGRYGADLTGTTIRTAAQKTSTRH